MNQNKNYVLRHAVADRIIASLLCLFLNGSIHLIISFFLTQIFVVLNILINTFPSVACQKSFPEHSSFLAACLHEIRCTLFTTLLFR